LNETDDPVEMGAAAFNLWGHWHSVAWRATAKKVGEVAAVDGEPSSL
jgi:hypothetical protein